MKALIAVVVTLVGNIFAYLVGKKSATNKIKADSEEAGSEYKEAGYEAGRVGEANERKVKNEEADTDISRFN